MKLDSKLFDRIRIRPRHEQKPHVEAPACAWEGCDRPGLYIVHVYDKSSPVLM